MVLKNSVFILLFFISNLVLCQQSNYSFNYFTEYDYSINENDSIKTKSYFFSNTKDTSYLLTIYAENGIITKSILHDSKNLMIYNLKTDFNVKEIIDLKYFKHSESNPINLEMCRKENRIVYDINYSKENGKQLINIKQFKTKKKKKLINESFFYTKPSYITKNQHFNFHNLTIPLWCHKFDLKNEEIITYSYYIENGIKKHFRSLVNISESDLKINIE